MPASLISYMKFLFTLAQLGASSKLYVNKREAKCTLLNMRHLLLLPSLL